jgi:hypothetical protein
MEISILKQCQMFIKKFVNGKIGYKDRVLLLRNANKRQIQCILEIIENRDKFKKKTVLKCVKSVNSIINENLNDTRVCQRVLCLHVPALRLLLAAALVHMMECDLNLILASIDTPCNVRINKLEEWKPVSKMT